MPTLDKTIPFYKDWTEGPFGVPMPARLAKTIEALARKLPNDEQHQYKRAFATVKLSNELKDGERADISILTTAAVDRDREVVVPKGVDLAQFRANPVVTFAHRYDQIPVGRAQWIRYDDYLEALKAKTLYETRPDGWQGDWLPDAIFGMVRSGTLLGKSIGFLPLKGHAPSPQEIKDRPGLAKAAWIHDQVVLIEYAVVPIPANPQALVEAVSKGIVSETALQSLGIDVPVGVPPLGGYSSDLSRAESRPAEFLRSDDARVPVATAQTAATMVKHIALPCSFVTETELAAAIRRNIERLDIDSLVRDAFEVTRGGV